VLNLYLYVVDDVQLLYVQYISPCIAIAKCDPEQKIMA
jgi:hypothetical protein